MYVVLLTISGTYLTAVALAADYLLAYNCKAGQVSGAAGDD